ncbi:spore germination protein GerPE [Paenibacillus sp. TAB 01]|uniref:spore germination protein GerPE n=1 Tax=Paenibacillus sp. TAB 01 TaxID=3368988 RepID=UPI003751EFD5
MSVRWSIVRDIHVHSIGQASIVQIGDNEVIEPKMKVLAVQRAIPYFLGEEGNFDYPLFEREIPLMHKYEDLHMSLDNQESAIQVGCVKVLALAGSSVFQVGRNEKIISEARIKHFRQYVTSLSAPSKR